MENKKNNPIGVFDSGIGGATVLKEIIKILPNEKYIYYSDSINNPYGDKGQETIIGFCEKIVKYFLERDCKAIVIACNTASAQAVEYLRKEYPEIPFIAIEPAYKMVHDYAYNENTLVMATKGTIESEKFNLLFKKYDNHKTELLSCIGLADAIEGGNKEELEKCLRNLLEEYRGKIKNVVLGCTHYPLVEEEIRNILGKNITFFNGAHSLAKHLKDVLSEKEIIKPKSENSKKNNIEDNIEFIDSSSSSKKKERFFEFLKRS